MACRGRARGLMQLIRPDGDAIARELQRDPPDPAELFAPELNRYVGLVPGAADEALLAPGADCGGLQRGPGGHGEVGEELGSLPVDLFVEAIPFRETRGYVKQVVADLYLYRAFYGGAEARRLAMTLPKPTSTGIEF